MSRNAHAKPRPGPTADQTRDPFSGPTWEQMRADRLARDPDLAEALHQTQPRARLAAALRAERQRAGLSLRQLAAKADWNHSYVSRMESVTAPWPSLESIGRYLDACGTRSVYGLVIAEPGSEGLDVHGAATLSAGDDDPIGALTGHRLGTETETPV
jgi:transcriptional regulator with XRE-family HTH domain